MKKIFGWAKSGAIGIVWSLIASLIHSVMVRLGHIDGISEWVVKYSSLDVENVKYILTAVSFFTIIACISLFLSIAILWVVKKAVGRLPSNRLKGLCKTAKVICSHHHRIMNMEKNKVIYQNVSTLSKSTIFEMTEAVMKDLANICKIKILKEEDQVIFLESVLNPLCNGDVERVRKISENWDEEYAEKFREYDRERYRKW